MLAHQLNSKNFNCLQAVKCTGIGLHVVLVYHLKSRDFTSIQAVSK